MNGLLFVTLLAVWREPRSEPPSVLPEAQASVQPVDTAFFLPEVGEVRRLNYQQWVTLIEAEMDAMSLKIPTISPFCWEIRSACGSRQSCYPVGGCG